MMLSTEAPQHQQQQGIAAPRDRQHYGTACVHNSRVSALFIEDNNKRRNTEMPRTACVSDLLFSRPVVLPAGLAAAAAAAAAATNVGHRRSSSVIVGRRRSSSVVVVVVGNVDVPITTAVPVQQPRDISSRWSRRAKSKGLLPATRSAPVQTRSAVVGRSSPCSLPP